MFGSSLSLPPLIGGGGGLVCESVGMANRLSDDIDSKQSRESVDLLRKCNLFPILIIFTIWSNHIIIIIIKKGWQCKAGREQLTPYQSEDPSPTIPTHRMKEE